MWFIFLYLVCVEGRWKAVGNNGHELNFFQVMPKRNNNNNDNIYYYGGTSSTAVRKVQCIIVPTYKVYKLHARTYLYIIWIRMATVKNHHNYYILCYCCIVDYLLDRCSSVDNKWVPIYAKILKSYINNDHPYDTNVIDHLSSYTSGVLVCIQLEILILIILE